MRMFKNHSISIINQQWEFIVKNANIKHVPRANELIYIEVEKIYFRVINVVYNINSKQGIFIVVERLDQSPIKKVSKVENNDTNTDNL